MPALNPDVGIVHAQRADRAGNVQMWGITGVQKEAVAASRRLIVTVAEVMDALEPRSGAVVLPTWAVNYVSEVPTAPTPPTTRATPSATTPSNGRGTRSARAGKTSRSGSPTIGAGTPDPVRSGR